MKKIALLVLFLVAGTGAFWFLQGRKSDSLLVDTTTVQRGNLMQAVSSTGTLEAVNTVNVGAQVSGTLNRIYVDYNSLVKKGDLLAEIDPSLLGAKVKQARANVLSARANLQEAQVTVRNAKKTRDRAQDLFSRDLIAESELDTSQKDYETSLARVNSAKASLAQAEANLEYEETTLGYTKITSPINGVITDRAVDEGQTVNSSQTAPDLFTIAEDLTKMRVATEVDEADIGQVAAGQMVEFTVDAYPDLSFQGKVDEIRLAPNTSDNVVSYTIMVEVANPDLKLMPGMTANVSIIAHKREGVFKVAASALRFMPSAEFLDLSQDSGAAEGSLSSRGGGGKKGLGSGSGAGSSSGTGEGNASREATLWLYEQGKLRPLPVKVGISDGMYTQISGDLTEGLQVVTRITGGESSKGGAPFGFTPRR